MQELEGVDRAELIRSASKRVRQARLQASLRALRRQQEEEAQAAGTCAPSDVRPHDHGLSISLSTAPGSDDECSSPLHPSGLPPASCFPSTPYWSHQQHQDFPTPAAAMAPWQQVPAHTTSFPAAHHQPSTAPWCASGMDDASGPPHTMHTPSGDTGSPAQHAPPVTPWCAPSPMPFPPLPAHQAPAASPVDHVQAGTVSQLEQALSASNLRGQLLAHTVQELEQALRQARAEVAHLNELNREQLAVLERQSRNIVRASAEQAALEDRLQRAEAELQELRQRVAQQQAPEEFAPEVFCMEDREDMQC